MKSRNEGSRHRYWPDKERVRAAATWCFRTRIDERRENETGGRTERKKEERERERERETRRFPDKGRRDEDNRIAPLEYQWRTRRNRVFEKNGFKVECGGTRRGVSLSAEAPPSKEIAREGGEARS